MLSSYYQAQKLDGEDVMKQLELGFAIERKPDPPIPLETTVQDKLEAQMASMIITVYKNGGIEKDDTKETE